MQGRLAVGITISAVCIVLAACGTFSAADTEPVTTNPDAQTGDGNVDVDGSHDGGTTADAPADGELDGGPCGPGATVAFFETFPTDGLPPEWSVSFPSGVADAGQSSLVGPGAPGSPPYSLRLKHTGTYGIQVTRSVTLSTSKIVEMRFKARIVDPTPVVFTQIVAEPGMIILRLKSDGANVRVEDGTGAPLSGSALIKLPTEWSDWVITLDLVNGHADVKTSGATPTVGNFASVSPTKVDLSLLSFVDLMASLTTPIVDIDDVAACLPPN